MSNSSRRKRQIAENIQIGDDISPDDLLPVLMTLQDMEERLVWIDHGGAIADSVTGRICKKEIATSKYAASRFMDNKKAKQTLNAWMKSEQRLSVDVVTWVPGMPLICTPPESNASARFGVQYMARSAVHESAQKLAQAHQAVSGTRRLLSS